MLNCKEPSDRLAATRKLSIADIIVTEAFLMPARLCEPAPHPASVQPAGLTIREAKTDLIKSGKVPKKTAALLC